MRLSGLRHRQRCGSLPSSWKCRRAAAGERRSRLPRWHQCKSCEGPEQDGGESGTLGTGKKLEIEKHLSSCACRRYYSLPCALTAPRLQIKGDQGTDQLETMTLYSSSFHCQHCLPLKQAGAEKHAIASVQKESRFPRVFGVVTGGRQLNRVSSLENSSVEERGCCPPLRVACLRRRSQHSRLPKVQTLPVHGGKRERGWQPLKVK